MGGDAGLFLLPLRFDRIGEAPPGMGHTTDADDGVLADHRVVALIAVRLQIPRVAGQQTPGHRTAWERVIVIQHDRPIRRSAALHPQGRLRLRTLAGLLEHLHRGLVHLYDVVAKHLVAQQEVGGCNPD